MATFLFGRGTMQKAGDSKQLTLGFWLLKFDLVPSVRRVLWPFTLWLTGLSRRLSAFTVTRRDKWKERNQIFDRRMPCAERQQTRSCT